MNEQECLSRMVAPGTRRPGKYREGVIQIHLTRACDLACFGCTQGSNLAGKTEFMPPDAFRQAVQSLKGYYGVVGVFGGNPALHPQFDQICAILREEIPFEQRGLWCNHPAGKGKIMRETFNPRVSNLNVHLSQEAYEEFKRDWPESTPCGLHEDSRHSPPFVAMKDVIEEEEKRWELISSCDINQHWSAMMGMFRGQLRAWFCEIAGAQSILHQGDPSYPDTGVIVPHVHFADLEGKERWWWQQPMPYFRDQVRHHCHDCGVPLRGYGELAQTQNPTAREQVSQTHEEIYRPKRKGRPVEVVQNLQQLGMDRIKSVVRYLQNSKV